MFNCTRLVKQALLLVSLILLSGVLLQVSSTVRADETPADVQQVPSNITVQTAALSPTSAGNPNDGKCDLREALQATFTAASMDKTTTFNECTASPGDAIITFAPNIAGQTITLAPGDDPLPFINHAVTITGPMVISGGGPSPNNPPTENYDSRLFRVASSGTLTLIELTLKNGFTVGGGGAILGENNSALNLVGVSFVGNTAYGNGGAIFTNGSLNMLATNFSGNTALGRSAADYSNNPNTGLGGAIFISGSNPLNISLTNFSGNIANKSGGALYMGQSTTAAISDSPFSGNVAQGDTPDNAGGGAIFNRASSVSITRSPFNGNVALSGYGGAIYQNLNADGFAISDSSFNANVSGTSVGDNDGSGGAIYTEEDMSITRSTFNANVVQGDVGLGGAITNNRAAVLKVTNSTFLANIVVENISSSGQGGAIANIDTPFPVSSDSTVELRNVTITDNKALSGGAIYNAEVVKLWNTIVTEGTIGSGTCAGNAPQNVANNIQHPGNACGGATSTDPKLETPSYNGGAIATLVSLLPKEGSPAIDAGSAAVCSTAFVNNEDMRGSARPKDGDGDLDAVCDIGATEADTAKAGFGSDPVKPGPLNFGNALPSAPSNLTVKIKETGNLPLIVEATISGANKNDFAIISVNPTTVPNGAPDGELQVSCDPVNNTPGQRVATLNLTTNDQDNLQVSFNMFCNVPAVPTAGFSSVPVAPGPFDFGEVVSGQSKNLPLQLIESGNATLIVGPATITGPNAADFNISTINNSTVSIADNDAPVNVSVTCTPTGVGLRTAVLTVTTNDPTKASVPYNLICEGIVLPPPFLHVPGTAVMNNNSAGLNGPNGVAVSPDGKHVYMADYGDALITVYERNNNNGLVFKTVYQNGTNNITDMNGPAYLTVSPDGRNVYVAAYASGAVVTFSRDADTGLLTYIGTVKEGMGYGCFLLQPCNGHIDGLQGAHHVVVSPDGQYVYVSGDLDDALVVLKRNSNDGSLSQFIFGANFIQSYNDSTNLNGVRGLAISPDGLHLYAAASLADKIVAFNRSGATGQITFEQAVTEGDLIGANPPKFLNGLDGAFQITVSPDGKHVYITAQNDDAIVAFSRNALNGRLTYLHSYIDGNEGLQKLDYALGINMSHDGRYVYASSYIDQTLNVFYRLASTGELTLVQELQQAELLLPIGVGVAPDGKVVYVASNSTNSILVYQPSNPAPAVDTLLPASAAGGSTSFDLTIKGENFLPSSQVLWNGVARPTIYLSPTELQIQVKASDVPANPAVTSATVSVTNPQPGGGSAVANFTILQQPNQNPVPAIAQLAPQSVSAGSPAFTLTIQGTGFIPSSKVTWNSQDQNVTYISESELQITVQANKLLNPGTAVVAVQNPGPGGGSSNNVGFDVAAPGQNPSPTLFSIDPVFTNAQGVTSKPITVLVRGQSFLEGAQAQWNGANRPTNVLSETQLEITLTAADVAYGGYGGISVVNPAPGGGSSNTLSFTIYQYAYYIPMLIGE